MRVYDGGVLQEAESVKNGSGIIFAGETGVRLRLGSLCSGPEKIPAHGCLLASPGASV
jgi:hypothetical protein